MAFLSLLTLLLVVNSTLSTRIAGFLTIGGSQYMNMRHTMGELASRGHEVEKHYYFDLHDSLCSKERESGVCPGFQLTDVDYLNSLYWVSC